MAHGQRWRRLLALLGVATSAAGALADCAQQPRPPETCAAAAARAGDDARLRIQGGSDDATNAREIAKVHIYLAAAAAASGNEAECRRQLSWVYLR